MFVCLANICRSPAAEAVFLDLAKKRGVDHLVHVESSGIGHWHIGQLPDERMRARAFSRGVAMTTRAQQFKALHFSEFDLILAADHSVYHALLAMTDHVENKAKVHLMTYLSEAFLDEDIPDPYYGGEDGFERVLDMLEESCRLILDDVEKRLSKE